MKNKIKSKIPSPQISRKIEISLWQLYKGTIKEISKHSKVSEEDIMNYIKITSSIIEDDKQEGVYMLTERVSKLIEGILK